MGELDLRINHRGRISGWFDQRGACASLGFRQFELTVDIKDLVLLQVLLASHGSHARDGMRGATAANESLRKGANPQNYRHVLLTFLVNSEASNGGPWNEIGIQDLQDIIFDTSPEACQRVVADVFQLLRLPGQAVPKAPSCFRQPREAQSADRSITFLSLSYPEGQLRVAEGAKVGP